MELFNSEIKEFLIFSKKSFSCVSRNRTLQFISPGLKIRKNLL